MRHHRFLFPLIEIHLWNILLKDLLLFSFVWAGWGWRRARNIVDNFTYCFITNWSKTIIRWYYRLITRRRVFGLIQLCLPSLVQLIKLISDRWSPRPDKTAVNYYWSKGQPAMSVLIQLIFWMKTLIKVRGGGGIRKPGCHSAAMCAWIAWLIKARVKLDPADICANNVIKPQVCVGVTDLASFDPLLQKLRKDIRLKPH